VVAIQVVTIPMSIDLGTSFWTQGVPNSLGVAVGLAVVLRSNTPRMGWIILASFAGVCLSQLLVVSEWFVSRGAFEAAAWWGFIVGSNDGFGVLVLPSLFPIMMLAILYPTGRLPRSGWRWYVPALAVTLLVGAVIGFFTQPAVGEVVLEHPLVGDRASRGLVEWGYTALMFASVLFLTTVGAMIGRYRRSDTVVRQQIKWFAYAVGVYASINLAMFTVTENGGVGQDLSILIDSITFSVIPIALAVALFRYRLFDLDRLVSRTVSYTLVLAVLGAVFGLLATLPSVVLHSAEIASWQVAATTLAVAALFNPLRVRVQRKVDRRFDRARLDAQVAVDRVGATVQGAVDLGSIEQLTAGAVDGAVRPASIGIWLREVG